MTVRDPHHRSAANGDAQTDDDLARAGIVHDVNQMLAVITGRAGLLLQGTQDAERARHLRAILLAADDAAAMHQRLKTRAVGPLMGQPATSLHDVAEQVHLLV